MKDSKGYTGMILSDEQRRSIQLYMKSVLGVENYVYIEDFFHFCRIQKPNTRSLQQGVALIS